MSGFNLRKRARVCYYEPEEPPYDEFIYCTECRDYVYEYCAIHGPLLVIPDDKVPAVTGLPAFVPRSALTVPRIFLHLAYSNIPGFPDEDYISILAVDIEYLGAGIGVFSTLTLPSGVRFGPYRGRRLDTALDSGYEWQLYDRNNKPSHVVDASDANNSNWMRYVNCSRRYSEQNLVAFQYQGELYYRTIRIVPRFTELLVFYGSEFANRLGVDLRR
ncbi:histone-lysine N-methyltransferase PRDM7-like, partial [Cydia strobilella]|uniref:histone-lysine N-methyltransferase PRDM7-like n=1 Tax=Cydia strobilella TaxID=1100964 RepID=UPI003004A216